MDVYILDSDSNRYENLTWADAEDRAAHWETFKGEAMSPTWTPGKVKVLLDDQHKDRPASDFPSLGGYIPVFSQRAVEVLGDMLTKDGELLPLDCQDGIYFAFNVTRVIDALDLDRSGLKLFSSSGRIMRITQHEFIPDKLAGVNIFKLAELPKMHTYVTDKFVERIHSVGLTGFLLTKVWSQV